MKPRIQGMMPQPLTAILMCALAALALGLYWLASAAQPSDVATPQSVSIGVFLAVCVVLAALYPVHIRYHTKVTLTTPPLYLLAVFVPPLAAALLAGVATLLWQLRTRARRGNLPSDMATAISRWMIVVLLASLVAHLPTHDHEVTEALVLLGAALVMFAGDVVTCAFEIAPMSGEPRAHIMKALVREGGLFEGVQYLLGMLGALAAYQQIWALVLLVLPTIIIYLAFKNAKEMRDGTRTLLESMADAVDLRDPYTGGHSRRVTDWCACILRELNIFGPEAELIKAAARVHDIGKIGVPDEILNKPGKLTPEEKQIMDTHPSRGAELLARYPDFARGVDIVRHHHERWDGLGYPRQLKGMDIPFGARVIAVADSFDAMTTNRPYRTAMSIAQAIRILREGRGTQWDAEIVDAFLRYVEATQEQALIQVPLPSLSRAGASI